MRRPVYNRSHIAYGIQHMLYQLKEEPALDDIKKPAYVIYVFIADHLRRLLLWTYSPPYRSDPYITYIEKNGALEKRKYLFPILTKSSVAQAIMRMLSGMPYYDKLVYNEKIKRLAILHFAESIKLIREKWPAAKPVILIYPTPLQPSSESWKLEDMWREIERRGWTIIDIENIVDANLREYIIGFTKGAKFEDHHPNEAAWDIVVPELAKKLDELPASETGGNKLPI